MKKYIMTFDQGTTSSRCIIYDKKGNIISVAQKEFKQIYPKAGWVEQDPMEIWSTQISVAQEAMYQKDITYQNILGIGITNQRETTIVWDKNTGEPVYNAIVWQCRRTADFCDELKEKGFSDIIKNKTGLLIDAYFSDSKIKWILDNVTGVREEAEKGNILFGTVETWLIWKLTEGNVHITDCSNASRTMLLNIKTIKWDDELLELFSIPKSMLPEVKPSSCIYGKSDIKFFGAKIPIAGAAGDQQAALFGQRCFKEYEGKMTYGTGGFMLINTGATPISSKNGLITTVGWMVDNKITYALEGSIFIEGAAIQWLRDEMQIISSAKETEKIALSGKDSDGVFVVPAFVGLGAPYWNPYARGTIIGISRGTTKEHIIRATLESLAYQAYDLLEAMKEDLGSSIATFKVDGGASNNNFLMQFQSNILNKEVIRPNSIETTSLGAAFLAGLALGFWKDIKDIEKNYDNHKVFIPNMDEKEVENYIKLWRKAIKCSLFWAKE